LDIFANAIFAPAELCVVPDPSEEQANHSAYNHPWSLKQTSGPDISPKEPSDATGITVA